VVIQLNEYWTTLTTSEANLEMLRGCGLLPEGYLWTQPKVRTTRPQTPSKSPPSLLIVSAGLECRRPSSWSEFVGIIRSR
jgi:hypothetical protein